MKILAIDSSGLTASCAIVEDETVLAEYTVSYKKTHSETLMPMINEICSMTATDIADIDAVAVAKGPGSFTGLRIGSATAKGLGLALEKPLIPVGTVEGLAFNAWNHPGLICPIMDARREQVYTGIYRFENGELTEVYPQCAIAVEELLGILNEMEGPVLFLGDGCPVYEKQIASGIRIGYAFAPAHMNRQRAASLGVLAMQYYRKGIFESADAHRPEYIRSGPQPAEKQSQ